MLNTSQKVILALFNLKKTRIWLANEMGVTTVTLNSRMINNDWSVSEIIFLKHLLKID